MSSDFLQHLADCVGGDRVLTDPDAVEPYVCEWRGLDRGECLAVVQPGSTAEVSAILTLCHARGVAVTPQGGNTGLVSGAVPLGGIVLSTERLSRVRHIDVDNASMTVEAGCILSVLQNVADQHGFLFPLSLASEGSCRIGGNLATNAGGNHTVRFGNTRENVLGLEVVLADGRIWNGLRSLRKNNTGYDLKQLFIGSEGTLGLITAATFRLLPKPSDRETVLVACDRIAAVTALYQRLRHGVGERILAYELMPDLGLRLAETHVPGARSPFDQGYPWYALIDLSSGIRDGGLSGPLETLLAEALADGLIEDAVVAGNASQAAAIWKLREAIPEAQAKAGAVIKHDVAVPLSALNRFLEDGIELLQALAPSAWVLPFGHVGDGNIHFNLLQPDPAARAAFLDRTEEIQRAMHEFTRSLDGTFSAEHGVGMAKVADMAYFVDPVEQAMMQALKTAFDPANLMNPGKVLPRATGPR